MQIYLPWAQESGLKIQTPASRLALIGLICFAGACFPHRPSQDSILGHCRSGMSWSYTVEKRNSGTTVGRGIFIPDSCMAASTCVVAGERSRPERQLHWESYRESSLPRTEYMGAT
jgi:hypothetical protein